MWILGIAALLAFTCAVSLLLSPRARTLSPEIWDVGNTARTYTTVVGTLSAFSVTSSIFIANLTAARESTAFESVMALFLTAFLVFIGAAMQFATTPNLTQPPNELYRTIRDYSYLLANVSFYLGLSLSWLGLPLLLSAVGLDHLSDIFIWMVLFAILGGAIRLSGTGLGMFNGVSLRLALGLPALCFCHGSGLLVDSW